MRWLWRSTKLPCKAHKNYHVPASLPFSINMRCIYMQLTLSWVQRYRRCTLGNKSKTRTVGGVIQHDGGVCHGDGDADFLVCDCARDHTKCTVVTGKERVKKCKRKASKFTIFYLPWRLFLRATVIRKRVFSLIRIVGNHTHTFLVLCVCCIVL